MKIAFMYSSQGSQKQGMGFSFYNRSSTCHDFIEKYDLTHLLLEDELTQTQNVQKALLGLCMMINEELPIIPDYVLGLSLGEYAACQKAGIFSVQEAFDVIDVRSKAMQSISNTVDTKMVAIIKGKTSLIENICQSLCTHNHFVGISNYNCPGQVVISGERSLVDQALDKLKDLGIKKTIELKTDGPFHTPYMHEAALKLQAYFQTHKLHDMKIPVIFNYLGHEKDQEPISQLLMKQVESPVQFEKSISYLINQGVDTFVEIGCGHTLSSFVKKVNKNVTLYSIENYEDLEKMRRELYE